MNRPVSLRAKRSNLLLFFIFLVLSICPALATTAPSVCHLDHCVAVEVVSKQIDQERGLMYRTSLAQNKGMLFVFTNDDKHMFWMKNMHFNLDILWISIDGRIVFIGRNIPACLKDPCPVYVPDKDARYVLELNSGFTAEHRWKVGDKLDLISIF
jgi:uncharacterized membrane protein (UPF0127 family)